jgi:hypothetical protein
MVRYSLAAMTLVGAGACGAFVGEHTSGGENGDAGAPDPGADASGTTIDDGGGDAGATCVADLASDPNNCGACNHDCLGGLCDAGECQPVVLVTGEPGVRGMAASGSRLLFTRESSGLVRMRLLDGGGTVTIISSVTNPTDVTSDGQLIFVTDENAGTLSKWYADGGPVWTQGQLHQPVGVTMDSVSAYTAIQPDDSVVSKPLGSLPVDGGQLETRMHDLNYPSDVAVAGGKMFAASGGGILVGPIDGGMPVKVVSPTSRFKDGGGDLIHTGLAVDGDTVFFTIGSLGIVASVPVSGGSAHVLATDQKDPEGIAVTADAIYWANQGSGTIMKLAR